MGKFKVGDELRVVHPRNTYAEPYLNKVGIVKDTDFEGVNIKGLGYFYDDEVALAKEPDVISHPNHYTSGLPEGVEVIDIIRAQGGGWEHSNAIKYVLRAQFKGNYKQDIAKAIQYLTWAAERWED